LDVGFLEIVLRSNVSRAELRYRAAVLLPAGMLEEQVPDPVNIEWPDTSLGRDAPPFRVRPCMMIVFVIVHSDHPPLGLLGWRTASYRDRNGAGRCRLARGAAWLL